MSDPLSLLRKATLAGVQLVAVDGNYTLGSVQLPESTSTAFKRSIIGNAYYYTLKDIVFFLANADLADGEYRKKILGMRITAIAGQDRQNLRNYLNGSIDTCPQIDHQVAASSQVPVPAESSADHSKEPTMSVEQMQEQRERFTAQMEKALQKTKTDSAQDALGSLKQMKRKSQQAFGGDADEEVVDKQFLAADKKILAKLRADELPAHTRSTVLNATSTDFSVVLKLFNDKILKQMQAAAVKSSQPAPPAPSRKPVVAAPAGGAKVEAPTTGGVPSSTTGAAPPSSSVNQKIYPIIIVPASLTTCITMYNVRDFLMEGMYISVEEKRSAGAAKERDTLLTRDLANNSGRLLYHVIDDPTKLSEREWGLVVAVFATGQLWQFKGWKYPTPVSLFQQVLGVHVCVDSAAVDPNILSWNCRVLKINLFKQHLNAGAAREFWTYLDDYVKLRRPDLLPSSRSSSSQHRHHSHSSGHSSHSQHRHGQSHSQSHGHSHSSSHPSHHASAAPQIASTEAH